MEIKHHVIKAAPAAKPTIGDILYGETYLSRVEIAVQELYNLSRGPHNRLVVSKGYGFDALLELGVNATVLQATTVYDCPWTENRYHWMYPLGVVTDDETKYGLNHKAEATHEGRPWDCRVIGVRNDLDFVDPSQWGRVVDAMLGHGYTSGTLPSDGHGNKVLATIPLSNGDELLVACWVWYNK